MSDHSNLKKTKIGVKRVLPTEAEWEFAARGGTQTAYSFGDDVRSLTDNGWYYDNSSSQSHAVGSKRANQYDLYDMHGNV